MTDYELAYLFSETASNLSTYITNHIGFVFAFLTASALAATRLSRGLMVVALSIFTFFQMVAILQINRAFASFAGLASRMKEASAIDGSDLAWTGILSVPELWLSIVPSIMAVILIIVHGGALYFFFLCRRGEFRLTA